MLRLFYSILRNNHIHGIELINDGINYSSIPKSYYSTKPETQMHDFQFIYHNFLYILSMIIKYTSAISKYAKQCSLSFKIT